MITRTLGSRLKESRRFGFLLKDVTRLYAQRFEQHAVALGLTLAQCKALMRLADCEGVSQVRLSELTDLDPMTLVRILDRMESEGWLERRKDPHDRRVHCLYLTSKAKPLLEDIRGLIDVANIVVDRPAVEAGLALLDRGGDFADGVIAHQGYELGGEVFVSFDKKAVGVVEEVGQAALLMA